jgi:hypothetical protein
MRGSAIVFVTVATGVIAFAEWVGGGGATVGTTTGGREGGAVGVEAQAANTRMERAAAVRFIVRHPCKKRDSVE